MNKRTFCIFITLLLYCVISIACTTQANTQFADLGQINNTLQENDAIQNQIMSDKTADKSESQDNTTLNPIPDGLQTEISLPLPGDNQDQNDASIPETEQNVDTSSPVPETEQNIEIPIPEEDELVTITISAAGDCTLGTDTSFGYSGSFPEEVKKNGYEYFFKSVKSIFNSDDLTIVNLETTLTSSTAKATKEFRFKGSPEYTKILKEGSIEAVNIANNHIHDYMAKGYSDTLTYLQKSSLGYFGYSNKYITVIKGIKIGCLGYEGWNSSSSVKKVIKEDIGYLKKSGAKLIIVSFHWGEERNYYPNTVQKDLGKYTIDCGADLVLGHHPHVIQGIQTYKGKNIVYSLGNFAFGGNRNPSDKDTFIYQQVFEFNKGQLLNNLKTNIIPCSVSSVKTKNNYQPTPLKGKDAQNILSKIKKYSANLH